MSGNDFMAWVLRSPWHGILSKGMMLITVTGRKTGKKYTIPVGYFEKDGYLWVLTSRDRTWWRNLSGKAPVTLLLKRKPVNAVAELVLNERAVCFWMYEYLQHVPQAARSFHIRVKDGVANAEDVAQIARSRLFVRIHLSRCVESDTRKEESIR
ncbi:MAG: nitroreductase/quinone reductase family protein [Chloroflexota bacterium]